MRFIVSTTQRTHPVAPLRVDCVRKRTQQRFAQRAHQLGLASGMHGASLDVDETVSLRCTSGVPSASVLLALFAQQTCHAPTIRPVPIGITPDVGLLVVRRQPPQAMQQRRFSSTETARTNVVPIGTIVLLVLLVSRVLHGSWGWGLFLGCSASRSHACAPQNGPAHFCRYELHRPSPRAARRAPPHPCLMQYHMIPSHPHGIPSCLRSGRNLGGGEITCFTFSAEEERATIPQSFPALGRRARHAAQGRRSFFSLDG